MSFEFKIPTGKGSSDTAGAKSGKGMKESTTAIKDLTKSIAIGNLISQTLSVATNALGKLFEPLIRVLSAMFLVIFLPMMPAITKLTEEIAGFTVKVAEHGGGLDGIAKTIIDEVGKVKAGFIAAGLIIAGIGIIILALILAGFALVPALIIAGVLAIIALIVLAWDPIVEFFGRMKDGIVNAWNSITDFFSRIGSGIHNVWNDIKYAFSVVVLAVKNFGTKVAGWGLKLWDIIKKPFKFLGDALKTTINGIIRLINKIPIIGLDIPELASGGVVNSPTIAMIGEAGPEAVIPLSKMGSMGNTTINVNNPVVRNESDIRKLTDTIARKLQSQGNRRFS